MGWPEFWEKEKELKECKFPRKHQASHKASAESDRIICFHPRLPRLRRWRTWQAAEGMRCSRSRDASLSRLKPRNTLPSFKAQFVGQVKDERNRYKALNFSTFHATSTGRRNLRVIWRLSWFLLDAVLPEFILLKGTINNMIFGDHFASFWIILGRYRMEMKGVDTSAYMRPSFVFDCSKVKPISLTGLANGRRSRPIIS